VAPREKRIASRERDHQERRRIKDALTQKKTGRLPDRRPKKEERSEGKLKPNGYVREEKGDLRRCESKGRRRGVPLVKGRGEGRAGAAHAVH